MGRPGVHARVGDPGGRGGRELLWTEAFWLPGPTEKFLVTGAWAHPQNVLNLAQKLHVYKAPPLD